MFRNSLIFICLLISLLMSCDRAVTTFNEIPKAINGNIDLTGWDFENKGPVKLDGEWEFYWNSHLRPEDFNYPQKQYQTGHFNIPGIWNDYQISGKPLGEDGFATFRLAMKVNPSDRRYALNLEPMASAYTLFVNGEVLVSNGTAGKTKETTDPKWLNKIADFSISQESVEIVLWVSNFHIEKGGPWNHINFGLNEDLQKARYIRLAFDMFLFGALFIMALYHFGLYFRRREQVSNLFFGLFCLLIARGILTNERFVSFCFPSFSWLLSLKLEFITLFLAPVVFYMFLRTLFPKDYLGKVTPLIISIGTFFSLFTLLTSPKLFTHLLIPYHFFLTALCLHILFILVKLSVNKKEGAIWLLGGFGIYLIAILIDVLNANQLISSIQWVPFGTFLFVFAPSYVLSIQFSNTFSAVESLSVELKQKNKVLSKVDELKNEFLANTSHELRTPLHGIMGLAESIKKNNAFKSDPQSRESLEMMISTCTRLASMVNDIQDFSRLRHNELKFNIKPVCLNDQAKIVIHFCYPLIGGKDLKIVNLLTNSLPLVMADEDRLQQILYNLIGNAVKFTEKGAITITGEMINKKMEVCVSDTDIGFESDHLERLFSPFEQLNEDRNQYQGGSGLGLAIAKKTD